jgi:hypothetical protein
MAGISAPVGFFRIQPLLKGAHLMKNLSFRLFGASAAFALCATVATPALALDPVCTQVKAVMQTLRTTPMHIYLTETPNFTNAVMAKEAGQIGMGGTKQSEEISTAKSIYVMTDGKWVDMQTSFAAMEADKVSDPDTEKALADAKCKALPDEVMFGQPTKVYVQSIPGLGTETKLWISKATGRPVRTDMTNDGGGAMKMMTVSRYEYTDVQPPAHAMTMAEMVKSKSGH